MLGRLTGNKALFLKTLGALSLAAYIWLYINFDDLRWLKRVHLSSVTIPTTALVPRSRSDDAASQIRHSQIVYATVAHREADAVVPSLNHEVVLLPPIESVVAAAAPAEPDDAFRERIEAVQKVRQARLADVCGNGSALRTGSMGNVFNFDSISLTYCCIAKCGSTTFKMFLDSVTGSTCGGRDIHSCAGRLFKQSKSREDFMPNSLLIVRNPWERLVSSYTNKFIDERSGNIAQPCYTYHGKSAEKDELLTFSEFVECILSDAKSGRRLNGHVAPISWHCLPCHNRFSYIATLETFADDLDYLFRYALPKTKTVEEYWASVNKVQRRTSEIANKTRLTYSIQYKSLSSEYMDSLVALYRADALLYGYPLHPMDDQN